MTELFDIDAEIKDANLSYLMLTQHIIRKDKEKAMYRLGLSEDSVVLIDCLSSAQIRKIANIPTLLCQFRFNEDHIWKLLSNHSLASREINDEANCLHAAILLSGKIDQMIN